VIGPSLGTSPDCTIANGLSFWGHDDGHDAPQREIVVWLRSSLVLADPEHDYLPDRTEMDTTDDRALLLADVAEFGHLYARCFDYLQVGNEVFGGAGGYKFRDTDFISCTPDWSGGARKHKFVTPDACRDEATDLMFDWLGDLGEAAIEGSALAGRPIRIVGPGLTLSSVNAGAGTVNRDVTVATADWCNERIAFFDLHAHYLQPDDLYTAIDRLDGTASVSGGAWRIPELRCSLEWGPKADVDQEETDYWDFDRVSTFDQFFTSTCPTPTWEEFVAEWEEDSLQFGLEGQGDFDLAGTLDAYETGVFSLVCYGPSVQKEDKELAYDMAAIYANQINESCITDGLEFSPLLDEYEAAVKSGGGNDHTIPNFTPHPESCDCEQ